MSAVIETAEPGRKEHQITLLKQLSHSSTETLATCGRRYELDKLLSGKDDTTATFDFGKAIGAGVQKYLATGDLEASIWEVFQFWSLDIDDASEDKKKKTFFHACAAVDSFRLLAAGELKDWKLMYFNGKPATELGFRIDLGDGYYYRGYLDAALQHRKLQTLGVFECKTTGLSSVQDAQFQNSNQGVGYSLILDVISEQLGIPEGPTYSVFYPVYRSGGMAWDLLQFAKTYTMRADFIHAIMMEKQMVQMYLDSGKFPKRGSGCYSFFRVCEHFDICDMSNRYLLLGLENRQIGKADAKPDEHYDFQFTLEELIDAQIRRAGG